MGRGQQNAWGAAGGRSKVRKYGFLYVIYGLVLITLLFMLQLRILPKTVTKPSSYKK